MTSKNGPGERVGVGTGGRTEDRVEARVMAKVMAKVGARVRGQVKGAVGEFRVVPGIPGGLFVVTLGMVEVVAEAFAAAVAKVEAMLGVRQPGVVDRGVVDRVVEIELGLRSSRRSVQTAEHLEVRVRCGRVDSRRVLRRG